MKKEIVIVHVPVKAPSKVGGDLVMAIRYRLGNGYIVAGLLSYAKDFSVEIFYRPEKTDTDRQIVATIDANAIDHVVKKAVRPNRRGI